MSTRTVCRALKRGAVRPAPAATLILGGLLLTSP
jgi:hypothetical protein